MIEEDVIKEFEGLVQVKEVNKTEEEIAEQLEKRLLALYNWALSKNMAVFGGHLVYFRSKRIVISIKIDYSNPTNKQVVTIDYNDLEIGVGLIDKTQIEDGEEQKCLKSLAALLYRISSHCTEGAEWIWLPIDKEGNILEEEK